MHLLAKHFLVNTYRRRSSAFFLALFFLITPSALFAQGDFNDRLKEIKKEIKVTEKLQSVKEKQAAILQRQLRDITTESRVLEEKITTTQENLEQTIESIDRIRRGIDEQERALAGQKKVLSQLIRQQYENGTDTFAARILLPRASAFGTSDYINQTQNKVYSTISRIAQLRDKMQKDRNKLEEKKKEVEDAKKKLEKRNEYLESARINKAYIASQTRNDINAYKKKISALEQEQISIRREIEQLELAKLDGANLANLPSKKKADLSYPVTTPRITQYYGRTTFSVGAYKSGLHNGLDIIGDKTVRAAGDGKVIATGDMGRYGYGRWAAIDHGNGLVTFYGHMRKVKVKKGQKIDKGERVGIMGTTGYSTGVHVHFSVFAASSFSVVSSSKVSGLKVPTGASVNPMIYL